MKPVLIKQPAGLGDILFLFKLASIKQEEGHQIIWPLNASYFKQGVQQYLRKFNFVDISSNFSFKDEYHRAPLGKISEFKDCIVITTDAANQGDGGVMLSKYNLANIDYKGWQNFVEFERNQTKEDELFHDTLQLTEGESYALINRYIGTPPNDVSLINIQADTSIKKVYLDFFKGYCLFDWCKTFENATELYLEATAQTYILEKLKLKATKLCLYSRDGHAHFPPDMFSVAWKKIMTDISAKPIPNFHIV